MAIRPSHLPDLSGAVILGITSQSASGLSDRLSRYVMKAKGVKFSVYDLGWRRLARLIGGMNGL